MLLFFVFFFVIFFSSPRFSIYADSFLTLTVSQPGSDPLCFIPFFFFFFSSAEPLICFALSQLRKLHLLEQVFGSTAHRAVCSGGKKCVHRVVLIPALNTKSMLLGLWSALSHFIKATRCVQSAAQGPVAVRTHASISFSFLTQGYCLVFFSFRP